MIIERALYLLEGTNPREFIVQPSIKRMLIEEIENTVFMPRRKIGGWRKEDIKICDVPVRVDRYSKYDISLITIDGVVVTDCVGVSA